MEFQLRSGKEKTAVAERNVENSNIVSTNPSTIPIDRIHVLAPRAPVY